MQLAKNHKNYLHVVQYLAICNQTLNRYTNLPKGFQPWQCALAEQFGFRVPFKQEQAKRQTKVNIYMYCSRYFLSLIDVKSDGYLTCFN